MITITNGTLTLRVTQGAFQSVYARQGYKPVGGARTHETSGQVITTPLDENPHQGDSSHLKMPEISPEVNGEPEDEEDDDVDLSEIPLSEMGFEQLCDYADELGLDHDGVRSKKEMRTIIREHLNS